MIRLAHILSCTNRGEARAESRGCLVHGSAVSSLIYKVQIWLLTLSFHFSAGARAAPTTNVAPPLCTKSILIKSLLEFFFYPLGLGKPINLHYFLTSTLLYFNIGQFWSEVVELFRCVVVKVFKILLFFVFDAPWMLKIFCC